MKTLDFESGPSLTIIRGLPGSGKSTLAKQISKANGGVHFEADQYFTDDEGVYYYDRNKISDAHYWCQDMTASHLLGGSHVVVSNTFTTQKEMKPYFEIAAECGVFPQVIYCQNNYGSVHNVPEEIFNNMRSRFHHNINDFMADKFVYWMNKYKELQ